MKAPPKSRAPKHDAVPPPAPEESGTAARAIADAPESVEPLTDSIAAYGEAFGRKKVLHAHPMLSIAIVNHSTDPGLTPELIALIVQALSRQMVEHVQPLWRILPPSLSFEPSGKVASGVSTLALFDNADQAGALGYHDRGPNGIPYGKVFVETVLKSLGGTLTTGANAVSVTLSHELLEMIGDEDVNRWRDAEDGFEDAEELCDAVEGDAYAIDGISVSNFVLPDWFDPSAPHNVTRFDFLSRLAAPFSMTPGGYRIRRNIATGEVVNVWGSHFPEAKKLSKMHPASRTARRHSSETRK